MRILLTGFLAVLIAGSLAAQIPPPPRRVIMRGQLGADSAEASVKQAVEQMGNLKKIFDRDIAVLRHIRVADDALTDPMQPANAVQKAYEEIGKAKSLVPEFVVMQGLTRVHQALEDARRSPGSADFGRLRALLHDQAEAPASRVVVRNASRLEDEILAWLKVQELITVHLRTMSEIAGESLRASQE